MSITTYSVRVEPGAQIAVPPEVLVSLGVSEGGYVDFDLVEGLWRISGRRPIAVNYFTPKIEQKLSHRQEEIEGGSYVEIKDVSARTRAARAE